MKTLEERLEFFRQKVYVYDEPVERLEAFIEYWTEHNEGGKKMRFEMAKHQPFNIGRRLGTWKANENRFGKKGNFIKNRYGI
jgi:hypothetical protein